MSTKTEALASIEARLPELNRRVLRAFVAAGPAGLTDEELIDRTGLRESTARPRRLELEEAGLLVRSGRQRRNRSGRQATVRVVNPQRFTFAGGAAMPTCENGCTAVEETVDRGGVPWIRSVCRHCGRFLGYRPKHEPPPEDDRPRGRRRKAAP